MKETTIKNTTFDLDQLGHTIADPSSLERAHDLLARAAQLDPSGSQVNLIGEQTDTFKSGKIAALGRAVHGSPQPCMIFNERGEIVVSNASAQDLFDAKPSMKMAKLAIYKPDKMCLVAEFKALGAQASRTQPPRIMRLRSLRTARTHTIVLTSSNLDIDDAEYIVMRVVDLSGTEGFRLHLAQEYGLTRSESAVLEEFMSGHTLEQIAQLRRRSDATIKKQFYALMAKFGVKSQTELLQFLYSLSHVFDAAPASEQMNLRPNRTEAMVLRPQGRVVEAILAGDMDGVPVVVLPTLFQRCFPAKIEQQFKDAGILLITVIPPGRGKTSAPVTEASERLCWADDIAAVLGQLMIERAVLFGTDDMLRMGVLIARQIPHRIKHILVTAPVLPMSYEKGSDQRHNLIPFSKRMQHLKPSLRKLSLRLFWRSLTLLHAKGMAHIFLRNDPTDLRTCLALDTLAELQAAFDSVLTAGFERGSNHHLSTFDDWHTKVDDCAVPITIYEGSQSRLCSRDMLNRFVADHANAVTLVEFETAGTSFPYIRPDLMIKMVATCQADRRSIG
ncbi:MAG: alpha/beta hydrolase [Paracoccaceae bacterium]